MTLSARIAVLSFYSFTKIEDPQRLFSQLLLIGKKKQLRGTVLIAMEGVNGSISGNEENTRLLVEEYIKLTGASDVSIKVNYCDLHPFQKFKIKLKQEIVAMNVGELDVENLSGELIDSSQWDEFINQDDVVLIDTRNDYEVTVGRFKGAVNPHTETFKQFPTWVQNNMSMLSGKKVAMYCTGGIRCEKSTSYLKQLGFQEVYHLKGGILQYLADTQNKNNLWQGECFVFDDRRAVAPDLSPAEGYWLERYK
jgi:UPF0176 protein